MNGKWSSHGEGIAKDSCKYHLMIEDTATSSKCFVKKIFSSSYSIVGYGSLGRELVNG